ncbi:MAG: tRNA uridine-5-carboxymethylaminomethyl(34) synthesis GTPase MnmE [Clostridia bacterium]|nr:tRNA uridine-5-carboxymethylaminomethyl(34) synthesis GTPase MnmE [Clostridia bacterium]
MSTIAAISTPNAAGGIGMIRLSGEEAVAIADRCFRGVSGRSLSSMPGYSAAYGSYTDETGVIDDGVAIIYRAPKSYTGEDVAELCCHGGLFVTQKLLRRVLALGAVPAGPGEFTRRAFMNGKMDLSQAEGVMKVISAQGEAALQAAENTLAGNVSKKIGQVCDSLISAAAALAAWADYPDEDIPAVESGALAQTLNHGISALETLIRNYDAGKCVTEGIPTVLCGKPNVGKSTLMNALSGYEKSIVTAIPGTTRDVVEETVRVGDILLRLADTAGLRSTGDEVERIGVRIAKEKLAAAGLVIAVFDASVPLTEEDESLIALCEGKKALAVLNKCDLPRAEGFDAVKKAFPACVELSAKTDDVPTALRPALETLLGAAGLDFTQEILANERQRRCCEEALSHLRDAAAALRSGITVDAVNVDIDCAVEALLTLTGKRAGEEVVNEVFRSFCVGK